MRDNPFGPWTTALSPMTGAKLSTYWVRRLNMLPNLCQSSPILSRRGLYGLLALAAIGSWAFIKSHSQTHSISIEGARRVASGQVFELASYVQPGNLAPEGNVLALLLRDAATGPLGARRGRSPQHASHTECRDLPVGFLLVAYGSSTRPTLNCSRTNPTT